MKIERYTRYVMYNVQTANPKVDFLKWKKPFLLLVLHDVVLEINSIEPKE